MSDQASSSNEAAASKENPTTQEIQEAPSANETPPEPTGISRDNNGNEKLPRIDNASDRLWYGEITWVQSREGHLLASNITTGDNTRYIEPLKFKIKGYGLPVSAICTGDHLKDEKQTSLFKKEKVGQQACFTVQAGSEGNVKRTSCYLPAKKDSS